MQKGYIWLHCLKQVQLLFGTNDMEVRFYLSGCFFKCAGHMYVTRVEALMEMWNYRNRILAIVVDSSSFVPQLSQWLQLQLHFSKQSSSVLGQATVTEATGIKGKNSFFRHLSLSAELFSSYQVNKSLYPILSSWNGTYCRRAYVLYNHFNCEYVWLWRNV